MFLPLSVTSQPVTLVPSVINVTGEIGDLKIIQIEVTNNDAIGVDITMEYVGDTEVFIPNSVINISASSTRSVNVGFLLKDDEIGWLKYTIESVNISQLVIIEISKITPSLMVFPESPKTGGSLAFMITSGDIMDASGILFCIESGNSYPIEITNGMGIIKLNENETGNAIARITGDGLNPLFANFTILGEENNNDDNGNDVPPNGDSPNTNDVLSINSPDTVHLDTQTDISIIKGVSPAGFESVLINKPSGDSYEVATNSFGKLSINFMEVGTWRFSVISNNQIITSKTICNKKNEELFLQTNEPLRGADVVIRVFDDALIKVTNPDGSITNGIEIGGLFTFTPTMTGSHVIKAESQEANGKISFNVNGKPKIVITDMQGYPVGFNSKTGKTLSLRLIDSDNNLLGVDTVLKIHESTNPYGIPTEIALIGSVGTWTPFKTGSYTITFLGSGFYDEVQTTFMVTEPLEGFVLNMWHIFIIIIVFLVIVGAMLKKAPAEFWKKKFTNWRIRRKGKKGKKIEEQAPQ